MTQESILSDLSESFKSIILDRFSNPFIFSFAISWSIINYRVFLIVFSGESIKYKLDLLEWYFHTPHDFYIYYGFVFPFISSIIYVFIYPFLNRIILRFVLERKLQELGDKNELEKSAVFTYLDIQKLLKRHQDELNQYKSTIAALERSEDILTQQLEASQGQGKEQKESQDQDQKDLSHKIDQSRNKLTNDEIIVINFLGHAENIGQQGASESTISTKCNLTPLDSKLALGGLQSNNFLTSGYDGNVLKFNLTDKGRRAFKTNNLSP